MTDVAYHFTADTLRNGRAIPAVGEWLVHDGEVVICESGLHASRHPFDALHHAPGNYLHLVECEDIVDEQDDKFVCRRRRILKSINAEPLLFEFARKQALSVIHLWDAPDVVRKFLETGDESLWDAAWDARDAALGARDAAWYAALGARDAALGAREAAWDAALGAREAAGGARDAAWYAALGAREAAGGAARQKQRDDFLACVEGAFR